MDLFKIVQVLLEILGLGDLILICINLYQLLTEQVSDSSCKNKVGNEVVLVVYWSMTESEPSSAHSTGLIKGYICDKLLSAYTILLAAVTLHLDVDEFAHL